MPENKPDTKTKIFYEALHLFAAKGVENVSMRDVADTVGIKAASIYNHYTGKELLVEACYDFFLEYYDIDRLTEEQLADVLLHGTKEEIASITNDQFQDDIEEDMVCAMIVLFSRMYTDATAIRKYTQMIDQSLQYLEKFLGMGIELGRFGVFNVRGLSLLFLSTRLFAARSITLQPAILPEMGLAQQEMITELVQAIPFMY